MSPSIALSSDAELVAASLRGDRDAFGTLVERHQQLVCALAYSRTGSVAVSEDIAQETFLAAWRDLARIRTPENFRGWLCGTTRHLSAKFHRGDRPSSPLTEDIADAGVAQPSENAITREEEAMLWAALERLPESHREPLILFYRGGQSVREIAAALEISEDAVKQRLSRGRAMLQEAVRAKVESALSHSRPGSVFTISVLAAIPVVTSSAQAAAGTGLAVAKGSGALAMTGLFPALGGSFIGIAGAWLGMRSALQGAESERERRFIVRVTRWTMATVVFMTAAMFALVFWAKSLQTEHPTLWIFLMAANVVSFTAIMWVLGFLNSRRQQAIRAEERVKRGVDAAASDPGFEYRSRLHFLGLPLVHIRLRSPGVAMGWIAAGNVAIAPLAAFGGVAVGGIAMGGVSAGLLTTGGIGVGLLSFSGLAFGGAAVGGLAIGWLAIGGGAWGWLAALGGLASAKYYAVGHHASAWHVNDAAARAFFHDSGVWQAAEMLVTYGVWVQLLIGALFSFGLFWIQKRSRRKPAGFR